MHPALQLKYSGNDRYWTVAALAVHYYFYTKYIDIAHRTSYYLHYIRQIGHEFITPTKSAGPEYLHQLS